MSPQSNFTRAFLAPRGASVRVFDPARGPRGTWGEVVAQTEGDWQTRTAGTADVKWADGSHSTVTAARFNTLRLEVRS